MNSYKTFDCNSPEILFKDKNSKFFGYGFPVESIGEVKPIIDNLRKQHSGAGHFCYDYQLGKETIQSRANDDGEPNNSSGMPIYGQIQSTGITNVLVVVVRYFGGTKLGVSGLINAYKSTALMVIEDAAVVEKTIFVKYSISFDYKNLNKVMRIIKEKNIAIITQKMEFTCEIEIASPKKNAKLVFDIFNDMFEVNLKL